MAAEHGDEYLEALAAFTEQSAEGLLDGSIVLKLKPLGLLYLDSRFAALSELEALRADAPVDYLRAVVAELGDYRKLEKLRAFLKMLERVKIVGANTPLRDSAPLRLSMFSGLRHLEINGCDLSTAAAKGLLDLKPRLETLTCIDSTDTLADLLADRGASLGLQTPWLRLTRLCCPLNGLRFMDPSLCSLPAVEEIDLSRNKLTTVANLHNCVQLRRLDLGFNSIASLVGLNRVVGAITQLILRGNGIHSLAGLEKLYAIEELDLAHNVIGSLFEVARLGRLPSLTRLWFQGNPIELRRNYRAEVLGLLQDGDKVELDGRESSTFERMAIRGQQRRNARTPRFPEPLQPSLPPMSIVQRAAPEKANGQKAKPSRVAEPTIAAEAPDDDPKTPPKPSCLMEHPEDDPERMFSARVLFKKDTPSPTRVKIPLGGKAPLEATTSSAEEELANEHSCAETVNRPSPVLAEDVSRAEGHFKGHFNSLVSLAEEDSSDPSAGGSGNAHGLAFNVASSPKAEPINIESESPDPLIPSSSVREEVEQDLFIESAATSVQGLDTCPLLAEEELRSPLRTGTEDGGELSDAQASGVQVERSLNSLVCFEESGPGDTHAERLEKESAAKVESGVPERKGSGKLRIDSPTDEKGSSNVHNARQQDACAASHIHIAAKSKVDLKDSPRSRKERIVNLDHES